MNIKQRTKVKDRSPQYAEYRKYYDRKRKLGYKTFTLVAAPEIIDEVKIFIRQLKISKGLYEKTPPALKLYRNQDSVVNPD